MDQKDFLFYSTTKYKLALCVSITTFFYCFLIFFLPFGVDNYNPNHKYTFKFLFEIFKFAAAICAFASLNEFVLRPLLFKTTSLKGIINWSLWTLLLLSTITFLTYNYLGNWHDYLWVSYLGFLINTSAVLIFPIIGTFFFFRYRILQHKIDHILTTKGTFIDGNLLIDFKGQGSSDQITLAISSFLYGKAQNNYVELYYLEENQMKKFLIRSSLHNLVNSIHTPAVARCHRSYMVNLLAVKAIKGGSQEVNLFLEPFDIAVPASKSYKDAVLKHLHDLKNFG